MRLHEEFCVAEQVGTVWTFFEQPEQVARCMPGVEHLEVLDQDNVRVRVMQGVGPLTATFDARVTVLERVPGKLIRFRAAGRSIRGAVGNMRTENTVVLRELPDGTSVSIDGDLVLAGALGSVGQKVITRQASKVTAQFAANLQRALRGEPLVPAGAGAGGGATLDGARAAGQPAVSPRRSPALTPERWSQAAAALSAVSAVLSAIVLARQRRRSR